MPACLARAEHPAIARAVDAVVIDYRAGGALTDPRQASTPPDPLGRHIAAHRFSHPRDPAAKEEAGGRAAQRRPQNGEQPPRRRAASR